MVLKLRYDAPGNWERAKCKDFPSTSEYDPFFSEDPDETQDAVDFCNGTIDGNICPIRHECLLFALVNNEKYGVWGGTTEVTRKALRKKNPPAKGNKVNEKWEWQDETTALAGLDKRKLMEEDPD